MVPSQEEQNNSEPSELEVGRPQIASESVQTMIECTEPAIQLELQDEEVDLNNNSGSFDEDTPVEQQQITAPPKKQTSAKGCQTNIKISERHASKGKEISENRNMKLISIHLRIY
ncbi:uncharacterized protein LOC127869764 [Dreissena polymorpha]|uniref:uncharacterized protein LOC127869764 n=1 Tax=Dreissena polymorpha TaxID=45954 RepID=UPI002264E359|nr:uncharacterized protein LOC127869764 [Dreissena polymorpha]